MIRLLRRLVIAPAVVALTGMLWVTLPLWVIGAAALSPVLPGRLRPLRIMWVAIVYLTCEALLLVVLFGLWLASGCGWKIRSAYSSVSPFFSMPSISRPCSRSMWICDCHPIARRSSSACPGVKPATATAIFITCS